MPEYFLDSECNNHIYSVDEINFKEFECCTFNNCTFSEVDANGILSVKAKDKGSSKEQSITITGASTLPKNEVEKMVEEATKNADLDKTRRDNIDLKNNADSLCYQCEKQLSEIGDKINIDNKNKINEKIKK